jgi:hypothetical protein
MMPNPGGLTADQAKEAVLSAIASGSTVERAMKSVSRSMKTWEYWRREDKAFASKVDEIRAARNAARKRGVDENKTNISFEEFRREYLHSETFDHMRVWIDVLEGREPSIKDGMSYRKANPNRVVINTPPFHAKSVIFSMDWPVYLICMNPDVRIIVVSKTQKLAKDFLFGIKQRLTHPRYAKLQATFGGDGGFKGKDPWTSTEIYVGQHLRASGEKDPTVQVLGVGGQIYGTRADWIILDDIADLGNAHQYESQMKWINREVQSRVGPQGHVINVGTRVAAVDIHSELLNPDNYLGGESPWTQITMPAVLRYADDPKDWITLWPRSDQPLVPGSTEQPGDDGLYPAWDGPALAERRESVTPREWSLIYQQADVPEDSVFDPLCVTSSINRRRKPGPLTPGAWGHPRHGKEGMYTIAAMDPAMAGDTFTIVGSVRKEDNRRFIENAWVQTAPTPQYIRETIKRVTVEYGVNEWVIESNAFQLFLTQDPEITSFLANRGVRLVPHHTSNNKADPDFGVASLSPLFGTTRRINEGAGRAVHNGDNLLELPDSDYSQGIKLLMEELQTWRPGVRGKNLRQDGPMALWFFEIAARRILNVGRPVNQPNFRQSRFTSRGRASRRMVVPAAVYEYRTG